MSAKECEEMAKIDSHWKKLKTCTIVALKLTLIREVIIGPSSTQKFKFYDLFICL